MNILIAEGMHDEGQKLLKAEGHALFTPGTADQGQIEALVVRSVFRVDKEALRRMPRLQLVAKLGTGLDNIDQAACAERGIKVLSARGLNAISTAEFTFLQVLNIVKNSYVIYDAVKKKDYRRVRYFGHELAEQSVGLIGFGFVGAGLAERLKPCVREVRIKIRTRTAAYEAAKDKFQFVEDFDELLGGSDIVILALSLAGNERMVNKEFLSKLKKNVILVNTARGGLVDEAALADFLRANKQAVYYCDVVEPEPDYTLPPEKQAFEHPLLALPNVLFTPHIAGMSHECQAKIGFKIAEEIAAFKPAQLAG